MGPDLIGRRLAFLEVHQAAVPWAGEAVVAACDAVGKHLVVRLELARAGPAGPSVTTRFLRVHLGMKGSWHRYRPGEAWARPPSQRRCVVATGEWVFVCFGPKEVVLDVRPDVEHLGPDLLDPSFEPAAVVPRARQQDLPLGEMLLAQTIAAGIGNVYKSESLFLERLDPWAPSRMLGDDRLIALYRRAASLMRDNLERGGFRITTRPEGLQRPDGAPSRREDRYWVYRRAGLPCRVCGGPIMSRLQGDEGRMTYWCQACQAPHG